jgi:uncharacterized repeat protein (TIGR03803 family)
MPRRLNIQKDFFVRTGLWAVEFALPRQPPATRAWAISILLAALGSLPVRAADRQFLHNLVPAAVSKTTVVRPSPRWEKLNLSIGLPLRNREALTNLLRQIYDPASTNFHHYLTPDQFTQKFGPTEEDYEAVVHFARTHGLIVTARHSNRALVSVRGTVADVERVFNVTLNEYQHPTEARTFRAPASDPSLDLAVPVLSINGLDDFVLPHANVRVQPLSQAKPALTGSGPGGYYLGYDFRAAYLPGVSLTGTGQTVGLLEFDSGYYPGDITAYEALAGLPNVPVSTVLLDGYSGSPAGDGNGEVSLDIEMAISMAPRLNAVQVYEGSSTDDILNRMATDDTARQLSASWTYGTDATSDQIFLEFAAQGQTFFNASGDSGAYAGEPASPTDDPNITIVGGTSLGTSGPQGAWASETVWTPYSGGGISARYAIPAWQQGVNMTTNQGSTTMRNLPDVAMAADNIYLIYNNGVAAVASGTSCATPLWAGFAALVNELALASAQPPMGFLNPAIYNMGKGSNSLSYASLFHDITAGNNENTHSPTRFAAAPGYDLCTGWGTPNGSNLLTALALPEPLRINPLATLVFTGPVGGPFGPAVQTFTLTNNGASPLNWRLAIPPAWLNISPTSGMLVPGGPPANVAASLNASATNLSAGAYTTDLSFTNVTDGVVQSPAITLDVVTRPLITSQPTNENLLVGMTASFTVGIASNALVYYQWQENGTNLTDNGTIAGSATATLTIYDVFAADIGNYTVVLSNAAGTQTSSNALLTIVHSTPVIVQAPSSLTVLPGANATFKVTAVGDTPYSYYWLLNGTNLINNSEVPGGNGTLTINNVTAINTGVYSVIVSNNLGSVTSTGAVLSFVPVTAPGIGLAVISTFGLGTAGEYPYGPVVADAGNYYGTTSSGGPYFDGTVFQTATNGSITTLFSFNGNSGAGAYSGLCWGQNGNFYGTTTFGGNYNGGTVYQITPNGGFTSLASFNGNNGFNPFAGLVQGGDGFFYGTANAGGPYGYGLVFRVNTTGTLTNLAVFDSTDGSFPSGVLVQGTDGNLYGTTENGGTKGGAGTIFRITTAGTLTTLYSFDGTNDGAIPVAGVIQGMDGNFYGTTLEGGAYNLGTVFRLTPSGALSTLYSFTGGNDGSEPFGGLVQAKDGNLYGTTQEGGTYGFGTAFQIAPTGTLNTIVQFDGLQGANPSAVLVQGPDGFLYGTTEDGGSAGGGTFFRITNGGPLQITGQPADQSDYFGGTALFTVATSGSLPFSYQWQQNGLNLTNGGAISGANSATLIISNVTFSDAAFFNVIVSNAYNSVASADAVLTLEFSPPAITSEPVSQTVVAGITATFSISAQGDQPLTYQWQDAGTNLTDGGNISGSATATLTLANVTAANNGSYSVLVSNAVFGLASTPALLAVVPAGNPSASLTNLHLFTGGTDGAFSYAALIQGKDGNLYGTASGGGAKFQGSLFRLTLAGSLTSLYNFPLGTGGAEPLGGLIQTLNGNFYGTTVKGGANGNGTLFRMINDSAVTYLYSFAGGDGAEPTSGLIQGTDGNFYGTAFQGGADSFGSVFQLTTNGIVNVLYNFTGGTDGGDPYAGLIQGRDGNFYGTTTAGGVGGGYGTVFKLAANGPLTTLVLFNYTDGAYPQGGLIQDSDGNFYGTTAGGGASGAGTVFRLSTNGILTNLFSFAVTNGAEPGSALIQGTDGNLYGTTSAGGPGGQGSVFKITTNGTLTTLLWFDGFNGASPQSPLVQASDGRFYGTTPFGGPDFNPSSGGGNGTIFRITVPAFIAGTFSSTSAIACLPYTSSLVVRAVAPAGDPLSFSVVSGPSWLAVSANGRLSGTPTNANIGTNIFVVGLADATGFSATATMQIIVNADPPPVFLTNTLAEPAAIAGENYTGDITTNATAPYINAGDMLTFGKVSGPAWLAVAANGGLAGTPGTSAGGSNTFVVSVTDLGGSSNTATLLINVLVSPAFTTPNLTLPAAVAGLPYSGSFANNVTDPELRLGDTVTFAKLSGPSWLTVATNAALSGTPGGADLGANIFLVKVIDSDGLAAQGFMEITVNPDTPPVFLFNPLAGPPATAGEFYQTSIGTNAIETNVGDPIIFSKLSGPAWLGVSAGGDLSGTPYSINAGTNIFTVAVSDLAGVSADATLYVTVTAVPIVGAISWQGGSLSLTWTGGVAPWQVQGTTNLALPNWQNVGGPLTTTNTTLFPGSAGTFYRIQGQ